MSEPVSEPMQALYAGERDRAEELLAASGDPERWADGAAALVAAADSAGERPAERVHVATGDGEVFAVRRGELTMVAVAKRFTLASLLVFDMRTV